MQFLSKEIGTAVDKTFFFVNYVYWWNSFFIYIYLSETNTHRFVEESLYSSRGTIRLILVFLDQNKKQISKLQ